MRVTGQLSCHIKTAETVSHVLEDVRSNDKVIEFTLEPRLEKAYQLIEDEVRPQNDERNGFPLYPSSARCFDYRLFFDVARLQDLVWINTYLEVRISTAGEHGYPFSVRVCTLQAWSLSPWIRR